MAVNTTSPDATNPAQAVGAAPAPTGGSPVISSADFKTATDYANNAATNAYNNAKLNLETEQQAFTEAQTAYTNALSIATTFGTSPGGTYNGMALPSKGTPTMAQANQWASLYGNANAPANQYQMTQAALQQQFQQQQTAQQNYALLSGTYTPQTGGSLSGNVNLGQIDQALQNSLGRMYNQNVFQSMTSGLQGQALNNPAALQAINAAIKSASQGAMQGVGDIAGALGQGAYTAPQDALSLAAQQQYGAMYGYAGAPLPGEMTQSMQNQLFNQGVAAAGQTGFYNPPNYTPQAQQQTASWDQLSGQLQQAAGGAYNDAAAKAAYQNLTGQGAQNFNGQTAAPLTQAQMQTLYNAAGVPVGQGGANNPGGAGGAGGQGQMTTAYQQQLFQQALDTAKFQQGTAQSYLQLLSGLQGPADYGQYLKTLGATPSGIQDLTRAAAGAYVPGAGATTGVNPQAQTLANFVNSATSGVAQGGVSPYQAAAAGGSATPGQQNPGLGTQPLASQAPNAQPAGGTGGTSYDQFMAAAQGLPAPNQLAPQAMANMTDSQKQMMQSMYQQLGYNSNDINTLFNQSLPKYAAGQGVATGSFKLQ